MDKLVGPDSELLFSAKTMWASKSQKGMEETYIPITT